MLPTAPVLDAPLPWVPPLKSLGDSQNLKNIENKRYTRSESGLLVIFLSICGDLKSLTHVAGGSVGGAR